MADLRRQLAQIDYTNATSMDDYLRRISALAEILPKLDKAYEVSDRRLAEGKKKYRNRPDLMRLIRAIEQLNQYDKDGLAMLKQEVDRAKWLKELPQDKQQQYFDEQIEPLRKKMIEVGRKEVEFARKMKDQGLALPSDVAESIK
ncbi:MAG: hypothetical protein ACM3JB_06835 [Acidobacteriaceae bacterium]